MIHIAAARQIRLDTPGAGAYYRRKPATGRSATGSTVPSLPGTHSLPTPTARRL